MLNRAILQGRTVHHPELVHNENGTAILKFSIAVNGKNTNFFDCFMVGEKAEENELMIDKGQEIFVIGQLYQREYKTKKGKKAFKTEIYVEECNFTSDIKNPLTGEI